LAESLIPSSQILGGGPPKDGIPSIDQPTFVSVDEVNYLQDEAVVLGINYQGIFCCN